MEERKLTRLEKKYIRKYSNKIDIVCCKHKGSVKIQYQIGYIGLRCCKVAICCDCESRQILCRGLCKMLLRRFLKKGIRRINILATISMRDMFMYR